MRLIETVEKMLLNVVVIFLLCCSRAFAEKNFWNNDICRTDDDCTGLKSCDETFGCTVSFGKVAMIMIGVFLTLCTILILIACLCNRHWRNSQYNRQRNQHLNLRQTVVTTNHPQQWNQQHQIGMANVYPYYNPNANQFYANSVNPPSYDQVDPRMVGNRAHEPTAPYPPVGFNYGHTRQTDYPNH